MQLVRLRMVVFAAFISAALAVDVTVAEPLGTGFTYQGQLKEAGRPFRGPADVTFRLFDGEADGVQIGGDIAMLDLDIVDGLLTVDLDFGPDVFAGANRWIEIQVGANILAPRQAVTPVPYAMFALAGNEGPEGPQGVQGDPGPAGSQGPPGADGSDALWEVSGSIMFYNGGNVGIGTAVPGSPLEVVSFGAKAVDAVNFNGNSAIAVSGQITATDGKGVFGFASASSGRTEGVSGKSDSTRGKGVFGIATASSGNTVGVSGQSNSTSGRAVSGLASAATGTTKGVEGQSNSVNGTGVRGFANAISGTNFGVLGETNSPDGYAGYFVGGRNFFQGNVGIGTPTPASPLEVIGDGLRSILAHNTSTIGSADGVKGQSESTSGTGVLGLASATSGLTKGVKGQSNSTSGTGVLGFAVQGVGLNFGVRGQTNSTSGIGVYGGASALSGTTFGVRGETNSPDGYAGYFEGGRNYFEGSVGMGTETPNALLEIQADQNVSEYLHLSGFDNDNSSTRPVFKFLRARGSAAAPAIVKNGDRLGSVLSSAYDGANFHIPASVEFIVDGTPGVGDMPGRIEFSTAPDGGTARVTRMTVTNNGNVGVGTTSPGFKLEVNGSAGKPGGGSWSTSSDRRLKKNIESLEGSLDHLLALRGVSFEYKDPKAIKELPGERIGVIAQEVEEVFPDWVSEGGHGYKTVTFRGFEALTVEALRELREEKDEALREVRARNADLESRVAQLEALITKLAGNDPGSE